MIDFLLKKIQNGVSSSGIEFYLTPELRIKVLFDTQQIILIDIFSHEFISERTVEFEIGFFGGEPQIRVGR